MAQWFRLYESLLDDPKVQKLPLKMFKAWVNILCLACRNDGEIPAVADIGFALRISETEAGDVFSYLFNTRLFDRDDDGTVRPHNWASRQYKSDGSAERMRRHRDRHRNVASDVTVTPSESEQIQSRTDTEQKDKITRDKSRRTKLDEAWQPSEEELEYAQGQGCDDPASTAELFKLHHLAKGTLALSWPASFKFWCRNQKNFARPSSAGRANTYPPAKTTRVDGDVEWGARLRGWYASRWWPAQLGWGPPPGEHGCLVPPHLLEKAAA